MNSKNVPKAPASPQFNRDRGASRQNPVYRFLSHLFITPFNRVFLFFKNPITKPGWLVYTVLGVSLLMTVFVSYSLYHSQEPKHVGNFRSEVKTFHLRLSESISNINVALYGLKGFFEASEEVSQDEWNRFSENLFQSKNFPGLINVAFLKRSGQKMHCILTFMTQHNGVRSHSIGVDACSRPQSDEALKDSMISGMTRLSSPFKLRNTSVPDEAVVFYLPIYKNQPNKNIDSSDPLERTFGWVSAAFNLREFFSNLIPEEMSLQITDTTEGDRKFLFSNIEGSVFLDFSTSLSALIEDSIAGRRWQMKLKALPGSKYYKMPLIVYVTPIIGIILSFLLSVISWSLSTSRRRSKALADQMTAELRIAEQRSRSIIESIPGALFRCSAEENWKMEYMTDSIREITGFSPEDFIAGRIPYARLVYPDDIALVEDVVGLCTLPNQSYSLEYRIIDAAGRIKWVYEKGRVSTHSDDGLPHLTGALFDITDKKKYEEDLRNLRIALENTVEGIAFISPEMTLSQVNDSFAKIFKQSASAFSSFPWLNLFHPDDRDKAFNAFKKMPYEKRISFTARGLIHEDQIVYLNVVLVPFMSMSGVKTSLLGCHCFLSDISEKIKEEEALARALQEAESANHIKSEFLATMSHELRTPLNAIIGYSELLADEAEASGQKSMVRDLKKIKNAGRHLLELINDVLDVSKLEAGKTTLYLETFNIFEMAASIIEIMEPAAEKNSNCLRFECDPEIGDMYSDFTKVRQALFNLLSNACKFTTQGTVTLRITENRRGNKSMLRFEVTDTGVGIKQDQLSKLFTPFMQADSSTTRKFGGTGLGLTITKRFCEMLGGSIDVTSEFGAGSGFSLILPRVSQDLEDDKQNKEHSIKSAI